MTPSSAAAAAAAVAKRRAATSSLRRSSVDALTGDLDEEMSHPGSRVGKPACKQHLPVTPICCSLSHCRPFHKQSLEQPLVMMGLLIGQSTTTAPLRSDDCKLLHLHSIGRKHLCFLDLLCNIARVVSFVLLRALKPIV